MKEIDITQALKNFRNCIDFTLLSPTATEKDLQKLCNVAFKNRYFAVCVNPIHVTFCRNYVDKELQGALKVCSVVGFPLGASVTQVKVAEAKKAFVDGADEIDAVVNLSAVKSGNFSLVKNEISRLVRAARKHIVKIIIEVSALNRDEIFRLCKICAKAKVDFVKTSTGFGSGGATPEVVDTLRVALAGKCEIKASGGISTRDEVINLIRAGATRIGTSREI